MLFQLKGEEPAPNKLPFAEQALALKRQNASDMQILEQLYSGFAKKAPRKKRRLAKSFMSSSAAYTDTKAASVRSISCSLLIKLGAKRA